MLKNIKSKYILKELLTYTQIKKKLEIIKYNKSIQNILDIDLIYYKTFSQRYFIGEKNGKGKEYDFDDNLIFEGDYLNGKRNGTGKEYYKDGKIKFEGEYLNGKRHGKGKKYYNNSFLQIFEGEYFEGLKWNGKMKIKFICECEMKEGKASVKEEEYNKKLIYEGKYLNGKKHGKGKEYLADSHIYYEGEYFNGKKWNGNLYYYPHQIIYEIKEGNIYKKQSSNVDDNIILFEGEYFCGSRNGFGKEYGYYEETQIIENYKDESDDDGEYVIPPQEIKYIRTYLRFEGEYLFNYKKKGREYYKNKKLKFEGEYILNKKCLEKDMMKMVILYMNYIKEMEK